MPFTRIEVCLLSVIENKLCVLLGLRERAPDENLWALPGGVIRTDLDIDLNAAVQRVAMERLNTHLKNPKQQITVGGKDKDPRDSWAMSIVYRAQVRPDSLAAKAGKRLIDLKWTPVAEVSHLALGHASLVAQSVEGLRTEVQRMELPFELLQPTFFLADVKNMCDAILGVDKSSSRFRQRLDAADLVEPVGLPVQRAMGRPAQMYRPKT